MPSILGYALVNTRIRTPLYEAAQRTLHQLRQAGQLAAEARVALNSQLCLAPDHRGQGLMPALTAQLHRQLAPRYDVLYATVHRQNPRSLRYHQREGYQPVAEDPERVCFLQSIRADAPLPALPTGLRLRPGHPSDAPALHALNQQWTRAMRGNNLAEGFLTTLYSEADYEAMCAAGEVVVLETRPPHHHAAASVGVDLAALANNPTGL